VDAIDALAHRFADVFGATLELFPELASRETSS
jgi:hypothetical protein